MTIHYPNGKKFVKKRISTDKNNVKQHENTFSNRGMRFEEDIQESCAFYLARDKAVIHKKPTPLQIVRVHYPKRSAAVVTEAYFQQPSTTDFNGVYRGRYVDFEAKETRNKTSFPLKNIHAHQIDHMKQAEAHGGTCFLLMHFRAHKEVYLVPAAVIVDWYENKDKTRKSIPKKDIEAAGYHVPVGFLPRIDFLKAVDDYIDSQDRKEDE
ncbi:Holliday junction resolvase RecU [Alkalicoccus chagannorensis]|uniref:Holliday junction resolvase RecU n=1 Tax=Alkalicoccus chagannorensis TaxID=427072 RepID=UPI00047B3541|nr:Holliday junction resolvase RecU [Alkalicoccus chagannorensis]